MHRVLIADGDVSTAQVIRTALEGQGYAVTSATDGPSACKQIRIHHPDLLVVQADLPPNGGFVLLHELQACRDTARLATVMVPDARMSEPDVRRGWSLGVDTYQSRIHGTDNRFLAELSIKIHRLLHSLEADR